MATVTAIVSAYYAEQFLSGRLANLLMQDPTPEVKVVAQRGSEESYIAESFDIKPILTPNVPTIYAAWNIAIEHSSGEYITNANSDDRLYPGALRILASKLDERPDFALCYADSDVVLELDGDPVGRQRWAQGGFDKLLESCFIGPMPMWRRSLHERYGLFEPSMSSAGDYEFWLRITSYGENVLHVPRAIGKYLFRNDSAERREPVRTIWETARARSRYAKIL